MLMPGNRIISSKHSNGQLCRLYNLVSEVAQRILLQIMIEIPLRKKLHDPIFRVDIKFVLHFFCSKANEESLALILTPQ